MAKHRGTGNAKHLIKQSPSRRVSVQAFAIDTYPVSRGEFLQFIAALSPLVSARRQLDLAHWDRFEKEVVYDDRAPIVGVTYEEAALFAWAHGGRLPTDWEWQVAARGDDMESIPEELLLRCSRRPDLPDDDEYIDAWVRAHSELLVEPNSPLLLWESPYNVKSLIGNADEWVDGVFDIRTVIPEYVTDTKPWQLWAEDSRLAKCVGGLSKYPHPGALGIGEKEKWWLYEGNLLAVSSPGSEVELIDVDGRIIELGFAQSDPDGEMIKWEMEREKTIAFMEGLANEDWSKTVLHPTRGEASVYVLAYQVLAHDGYHIEHFSQFLMPEAPEPFISVEAPHLVRGEKPVYTEFIQTRSMSVGIYVLPAGSVDGQVPHLQDELYYVISGRGKFEYEGQEVQVGPASSLFVAAEREHRFFNIVEDLRLLVVFSTPTG